MGTLFVVVNILSLLLFVNSKFEPYADNSGTVVALALHDCCIVASDTRLSDSYMIRSRNQAKILDIGNGILFSGSGCWSDIHELTNILKHSSRSFEWENLRTIQVEEMAYLLSSILYKRRFFPFYSFSILSGLDDTGSGSVYKYDAVGSWERVRAACVGKGEKLIQPMLDELSETNDDLSLWQLSLSDQFTSTTDGAQFTSDLSIKREAGINYIRNLTREKACTIIRSFFHAAAEREISIGDGLDLWILERPLIENTKASQEVSSVHKQLIKSIISTKTRNLIEKRNYKLPNH